jgi:hypothetical protein
LISISFEESKSMKKFGKAITAAALVLIASGSALARADDPAKPAGSRVCIKSKQRLKHFA